MVAFVWMREVEKENCSRHREVTRAALGSPREEVALPVQSQEPADGVAYRARNRCPACHIDDKAERGAANEDECSHLCHEKVLLEPLYLPTLLLRGSYRLNMKSIP